MVERLHSVVLYLYFAMVDYSILVTLVLVECFGMLMFLRLLKQFMLTTEGRDASCSCRGGAPSDDTIC